MLARTMVALALVASAACPCCNYDAALARQSIAAVADFITGLDRH